MKRLCCFVFVLGLTGAASEAIEKRIVGGTSCNKERGYHVQVESVQGGKKCGGSLLNTRWVLTASHCAEQLVTVKVGVNAGFSIKAKAAFQPTTQKINREQQFTFKDDEERSHDIVLIKLNKDVFAKFPTIELPPAGCTRPEEKQQVQIGGWGAEKAKAKARPPMKLKCATTVMSKCGDNDKPGNNYHSDESTTMCAFKPGVEACYGDAGSAVEYNKLLHGIIVSNPVDTCAKTVVMLDICYYRDWIDKIMQENS